MVEQRAINGLKKKLVLPERKYFILPHAADPLDPAISTTLTPTLSVEPISVTLLDFGNFGRSGLFRAFERLYTHTNSLIANSLSPNSQPTSSSSASSKVAVIVLRQSKRAVRVRYVQASTHLFNPHVSVELFRDALSGDACALLLPADDLLLHEHVKQWWNEAKETQTSSLSSPSMSMSKSMSKSTPPSASKVRSSSIHEAKNTVRRSSLTVPTHEPGPRSDEHLFQVSSEGWEGDGNGRREEAVYTELFNYLVADEWSAVTALIRAMGTRAQEFAHAVVNVMIRRNCAQPLLQVIVDHHLRRSPDYEPDSLFRSHSREQRIVAYYISFVGRVFLERCLGPFFLDLPKKEGYKKRWKVVPHSLTVSHSRLLKWPV